MAYNPLSREQQERRHKIEQWLPFVILGVILSLMGWGVYQVHKSAKLKHAAAVDNNHYCVTLADGLFSCGNVGTQWIRCNAGMEVTNLRDCPEYREPKVSYAYLVQVKRKHKRKAARTLTDGNWDTIDGGFALTQRPAEHSYMQIVGDKELDFRQWDKAGSHYTIDASPNAFDCPAKFEDSPDRMHSQLVIRCTPKDEDFPDHATTPADITNLMEQIAPTPTLHRHELGCVMPADIDVCPVQMIDPKKSHD